MSPEELKTLGRRITDELFNQGDLTVADELFHPHYTEHITTNPTAQVVEVETFPACIVNAFEFTPEEARS